MTIYSRAPHGLGNRSRNRKAYLAATISLGALLYASSMSVAPALAASLDWIGGNSTDFGNNTNWSGNAVPGASDNVYINVAPGQFDARIDAGVSYSVNVLEIGRNGNGTLFITGSGSSLASTFSEIGYATTDHGTLNVLNSGTWTNSGNLRLGVHGYGAFSIWGGGTSSVQGSVAIGALDQGRGILSVADAGSSLSIGQGLLLGAGVQSSGELTVASGATVSVAQDVSLGLESTSTGKLSVSSGATFAANGAMKIGVQGDGRLTLDTGGTVEVGGGAGTVFLAENAGSKAVLTLGLEEGVPDLLIAAGTLNAKTVHFGDGTGEVVFNHSGSNYVFAAGFQDSGIGSATIKQIAGTTILTGDSANFTGNTIVSGGTLIVNGGLGGTLSVSAGGALTGAGNTGTTTIQNGGILQGVQGQTLAMKSLTLDAGSKVNVALGAPGNSAGLFNVYNNLTLNGTLNVTDAGGFGAGVYRIFDYGGALIDNGMTVGAMPGGATGALQTAVANQVNLVVDGAGPGPVPTMQFWNGMTTVADGTIHGGNGTWSAGPTTNWTDANGATAAGWGGNFAVFQNNPGNVTVDGSSGAVKTTGMQFIGQGWNVAGDAITLNGANGSTTIRVGDGSAAGASDYATIASELTGASRLVKDDLGTLILTGANSYTGGTTIAAGTLQIGNGGTTGSITGDVLNNGTLSFNRSDATTFGGLISGSGAVRLMNGELTVTADNSYTGGTTVAAGSTLRLGNGGTAGSIVGDIANSGSLVFNRSNELTLAGVLSGNGAIRQIGSGKTVLTGDSSGFTGSTTIENGILAVNGQLGGSMDVWSAGRLQGTGTIGDTIVSGTIAPGNSIGTLNVAGNITFNPGSIYEVEVNAAGQGDRIIASGTATIGGGTVKVLAGAGNYAPQTQYTILTGKTGRTGTFSGVTSNLAFLDPSLSYDASNVYLTMTRNDISFQNVGLTPNQIATGGGVESLGFGNPVYNAVLNLSAPQAQYAFDQLSGEIHASARTALIEDSRFVRNAVNDRIRAAFDGVGASGTVTTYVDGKPVTVKANTDRLALWGQGFGSWGHTDGDGNAATLNRKTGGFFVGADAPVFDTWRFGAVAGYSRTDFDVKSRHSSGSSDNYHLGLYGGTAWGDLAFRTGAAYTWHDISTNRNVIFPGFGNSLKGDYNAATAQVFGELAYGLNAGGARFEPFANLAYVNLHTDGFRETGGAAALTSPSSSTSTTFTTLGLRASTTFNVGGSTLTAKGMLGWRHAFGDVTPLSTMRFAGGGNAFSIGGVPITRDAAVIEAGLDYAISPNATLGVTYGGQFGSGMADQSVKANFNMKF